jgi:phosphate:Na+ symporter
MGLGLIFFGMELMSIATGPVRGWPPFIELMQNMKNPLLSVAMGAMFTAIVQSSSATTGIVIVLASQGLISLESGIGLIFGSNIGTCVTAIISSLGRPREALQAACAHVIFNVLGVTLWLAFIPQFADLVRAISPVSNGLQGMAQATADVPRQVANAHTLFNIANLLIFIWFTGPLARLVEKIVPIPPAPLKVEPRYLDEFFLTQPALALDQVRRELLHLGQRVQAMIDRSIDVALSGTESDLKSLIGADDDVDRLYEAIILYLGKLSQAALVTPQPQQLQDFVGIANYLENIGDMVEKDLQTITGKRIRKKLVISHETAEELRALAREVSEAFSMALKAIETGQPDDALEVVESKETVNSLAEEASALIVRRLIADEPNRLKTFEVETHIIDTFKRFNAITRRIAKLAVDEYKRNEKRN